jgi:hypothetical protein
VAVIVLYDAKKCDWNERLAEAERHRPPGDGMLVAIPRGGRAHRDLMRKTARQEAIEKTHRKH